MNQTRLNLQIGACHRCTFSQSRRTGGCRGPCPCHVDGRDILEHATNNYCPAGFYPFAGLGSAVTWLLWHTGAARLWYWLLRTFKWKCKCGERATAIDRFGWWFFNRLPALGRKLGIRKAGL